tara:strand:- start:2920 stop:3618 length:699 start_codon:yes stop_codon:yes gene_type:complete
MKNKLLIKDYRYERKFIVPPHMETIVPSIICTVLPEFLEIYTERRINSIYFDTGNFDYALNHINGFQKRRKVRIRYYGKYDNAQSPSLESKIRDGLLGYKLKTKLNDFGINTFSESIINLLPSGEIRRQLNNEFVDLSPKVFITYLRSYYLSICGNFRITFDRSIDYYSLLDSNYLIPQNKNFINEKHCVIELKYNLENDSSASDISKHFNFRLTNNSKYINSLLSHGLIYK